MNDTTNAFFVLERALIVCHHKKYLGSMNRIKVTRVKVCVYCCGVRKLGGKEQFSCHLSINFSRDVHIILFDC